MAIIRVSKAANYSCINNQPIRDTSLTWAARGLLIYLLSMPDDWTIKTDQLVSQGPLGRDGVLSLIRELESAGYVSRTKSQGAGGKWQWEHLVHETPKSEEIPNEKPSTAFPVTVKPAIYQVLSNQILTKKEPPLPPESNGCSTIQPVPPPFHGKEFTETLAAFKRHRTEMKEPLSLTAERLLYKKLAGWTEKTAIEALENSILNRWRGVFEPRAHSPNYLPTQAEMNAGGRGKLVI